MKRFIQALALVLLLGGLFSQAALAQNFAKDIDKLRKNMGQLQLDLLQMQNDLDGLLGGAGAEKEQINTNIKKLAEANAGLANQITALKLSNAELKETLEAYRRESASAKLAELQNLVISLLEASVLETTTAETLVLEVVNSQSKDIPKDLLVFFLAEAKKRQGIYDESVGFYGAVISDYPDSPYLLRSIWEIGELLGALGQSEDQVTMLKQLMQIDPEGDYGYMAQDKLDEMGIK